MFEDYKDVRKKFEKAYFNYINVKNKYNEKKKYLELEMENMYKSFYNNETISDTILLHNIKVAYNEYYNSLYEELGIGLRYDEVIETAYEFVHTINEIENLYQSSALWFINKFSNKLLVLLTLKDTLDTPIIKDNKVYIFNEDLNEEKSKL